MPPSENEWPPELKEAYEQAHRETYREVDVEAIRQDAIAHLPQSHRWQQQGPYIVCTSCKPSHSQYVGPRKSLNTDEEGHWILTDRF